MLGTRLSGLTLLAVLALGCGQDSTQSVTAPFEGPSLSAGRQRAPNAKASGHVEVNKFGYFDMYTFEARSRQGTVTGRFRWVSDQPNGEISRGSGSIVCLSVVGRVAHVAGRFEEPLSWAPPPFDYAVWTVIDNDKGGAEAPDMASLIIAFKTREQAEAHCVTGGLAIAPLDRGDVKVRGGTRVAGIESADDEDEDDDEDDS